MSKEIADLMEAYSAVYAPQELTEEQVWEEVENWVNSLLEEGYDLSDYTWEEMYEAYLNEAGWTASLGAKLLGYGARGLKAASVGAKPVLKNVATKGGKYGTIAGLGLAADELLTRGAGRELVAKSLEQSRKLGPALRGEPEQTASAKVEPSSSEKPGKATGKIVAAAGGKGGTVTSGTKYAATLGGKKGNVTYDDTGKKTFTADSYEYDAYDLVLEYLLSQGHVDTVEEANYVMMEMDSETIGTIVEAAKDQSDKQIEKGVKTTYKAGNVLDNTHQGRSPGLNKLPRGEREEKAQRMRGRLKARRDDLFKERGNREDEKREKLKKLLGL
jgi:hypothetical protein